MDTDQMKGKFKQMTGEISPNGDESRTTNVTQAEGAMEKLFGRIQQRTGERRRSIEDWLKQYA